jgi:ferrochelatase
MNSYDAVLLLSFGGPEGPDDVMPFLENVTRGRNVPQERLLEVAEHYYLFGGVSPINEINRTLIGALLQELNAHGPQLPVYWGNRNWHPLLTDIVEQMADDGIRHALAFPTSAFGSYSGCRQYRDDLIAARKQVGDRAPEIDVIRRFYNHPGFIEVMIERTQAALAKLPEEARGTAPLIFTAHSIPMAMARTGPYEKQLHEACRLVAQGVGRSEWTLAYQSRSGPPTQPWLEPDVLTVLREFAARQTAKDVVICPIGFVAEHMEVIFDIDVEAAELCDELKLNMVRTSVANAHPRYVQMIRELILERTEGAPRLALGTEGPAPDGEGPESCTTNCCLMTRR